MKSEERPRRCLAENDAEGDAWASLNAPPGEAVLGGAVDPVGLEPGLHVLVAGDGDELLAAGPDGLLEGVAADLGDGAVHDGRVLVEDDQVAVLGEEASQGDAELLAGGQDTEGPQPGGPRGEADA
jgi:hypothetical protein